MFAVKHSSKSETGKIGEDLASKYLTIKGYRIIDKNYREKWGEIDIIARAPDKTIVFIEVKSIAYKTAEYDNSNINLISPEENLTKSKLLKLKRTASLYIGFHQDLLNEDRGWRIDLISVRMFAGKHRIEHFENV